MSDKGLRYRLRILLMNRFRLSTTLISLLSKNNLLFFKPLHFRPKLIESITMPRRSQRLMALQTSSSSPSVGKDLSKTPAGAAAKPKKKKARLAKGEKREKKDSLPRTLELEKNAAGHLQVMGVDEAGRGPLCGPVVAAGLIYPKDAPSLAGIIDSKKITLEKEREALYEQLTNVPGVCYAVSVIDAEKIDEINILQATLLGMRSAAIALVCPEELPIRIASEASAKERGCYVVSSQSDSPSMKKQDKEIYFSLIDGNKVPNEMPCEAEAVVKGDSKEYIIAAASIIAKVTRDKLMHEYDKMYPEFNLAQHKGYPTAAHVAAISSNGVTPIHRRTFAPIKHMDLDGKPKKSARKKKP